MMSTWNFIQSHFEKSNDNKHNSHLNISFRILDDMALSDGNHFTNNKKALKKIFLIS